MKHTATKTCSGQRHAKSTPASSMRLHRADIPLAGAHGTRLPKAAHKSRRAFWLSSAMLCALHVCESARDDRDCLSGPEPSEHAAPRDTRRVKLHGAAMGGQTCGASEQRGSFAFVSESLLVSLTRGFAGKRCCQKAAKADGVPKQTCSNRSPILLQFFLPPNLTFKGAISISIDFQASLPPCAAQTLAPQETVSPCFKMQQ